MAYFNPLHSHVAQSQVSTYSSLVDAFGEPSRTLGRRRCVPYPPSGLSATNSPTWPRNIPLSEASPNLRIDFNMLGAALGSGLPVVALVNLEKNALASLIADPHDQIYVKGFDNLKLQIYVRNHSLRAMDSN